MSALLEAKGVSKRFGGVQALTDVSFAIEAGQIYGLIGPNGAGKTTLFNVLTGIYAPDSGSFIFSGRDISALRPDRVAAAGIARTFQNIRLFANLSALENVMIGRHVRTRAGVWGAVVRNRATREEERAIERRAQERVRDSARLFSVRAISARAQAAFSSDPPRSIPRRRSWPFPAACCCSWRPPATAAAAAQ